MYGASEKKRKGKGRENTHQVPSVERKSIYRKNKKNVKSDKIKKCLCKVYSYDILIVERENQQRGQDMNLKRIAQKLLKMDYKKMCIELEKLHSILTVSQWQKVHGYIMYR